MAELPTCTACGSSNLGWETETETASEAPAGEAWMEDSGLVVTETCRCFHVCRECGHRWESSSASSARG